MDKAFEVIYFDFLHNVGNLLHGRVSAYWSGPKLPAAGWPNSGLTPLSGPSALAETEARPFPRLSLTALALLPH